MIDKSVDDMDEREVRRELEWWRYFLSKLSPDSEMPRVGGALCGYMFTLTRWPQGGKSLEPGFHGQQR